MISNLEQFDASMVRRYIQTHGLDPVPEGEPIQAVERAGATLTVETYGWGRVFFAEWRGYSLALTWCEQDEKQNPMTLPAWAEDLRALVDRPECLGHHQADQICDGGPDPETGRMERPCRWRAACMYVKNVAQAAANVPSVLKSYTDRDLWDAVGPSAELKGALEAGRREAARRRKKETPDNLKSGDQLVRDLVAVCCEKGEWTLNPNRWRSTVGQFFLVEYPRSGRESAIFILFRRRSRGPISKDSTTEQSIARFLTQTSSPRITVQLRTGNYDLVRQHAPNVRVTETYDTYPERKVATFRSVEEQDLDEVSDAIVQVVVGNHLASWGYGALDADRPGLSVEERAPKAFKRMRRE